MNPTQKLIIRELLKQGCATQKQLTAATRAAPTAFHLENENDTAI